MIIWGISADKRTRKLENRNEKAEWVRIRKLIKKTWKQVENPKDFCVDIGRQMPCSNNIERLSKEGYKLCLRKNNVMPIFDTYLIVVK